MEKEYRFNSIESVDDNRIVYGYAVVFESESRDLGFVEVIHKGAITEETIKNSDVIAKLNHDDDKVLARSRYGNGSLKLSVDEVGVRYEFEAPHTNAGDECVELCKRGDLFEASFAFTVSKEEGSEKWTKRNGVLYRDIYKIDKLYDISPVYNAAYAATSAYARKLDESKALEEKLDAELKLLDELFNI